MLTEWNTSPIPADLGDETIAVHVLVASQAARTPHAIALIAGDRRLTYEELDSSSNRFAHYLRETGVQPGGLVHLSLERSPEAVIAIVGTLKAGCAFLALERGLSAERLSFLLNDARLRPSPRRA